MNILSMSTVKPWSVTLPAPLPKHNAVLWRVWLAVIMTVLVLRKQFKYNRVDERNIDGVCVCVCFNTSIVVKSKTIPPNTRSFPNATTRSSKLPPFGKRQQRFASSEFL